MSNRYTAPLQATIKRLPVGRPFTAADVPGSTPQSVRKALRVLRERGHVQRLQEHKTGVNGLPAVWQVVETGGAA